MREVDASEVAGLVQKDRLTVVDCYAPWCGPCQVLRPKLESLSQKLVNVTFIALNIDGCPEFTTEHNVRSIPTLLFYKSGELVRTLMGIPSESFLREKIEEHM